MAPPRRGSAGGKAAATLPVVASGPQFKSSGGRSSNLAVPPLAGRRPQNIPPSVLQLFFSNAATEKRESLLQFANSQPAIVRVGVPGTAKRYKQRSKPAKLSTSSVVTWTSDLHWEGWTLDGNFSPGDFGIDHMGQLKGDMSLVQHLKRLTGRGRRKDMIASATVIDVIHGNMKLPFDLVGLIALMRNFDKKYYPLIISHICHEEEDVKSATFTRIFDRLIVLKTVDPGKYANILNSLPYQKGWHKKVSSNYFIAWLMRYKRSNTNTLRALIISLLCARITYKETTEALLELHRNGQAHLEKDYSIDMSCLEASVASAMAALGHKSSRGRPKGFSTNAGNEISGAISSALNLPYSSIDAAKAAAIAAATTMVNHPHRSSAAARNAAAKAATAAAAAIPPPTVVQTKPPRLMFEGRNVEQMFHASLPALLVRVQWSMFDNGEVFRLGDGNKVVRLTLNHY